MKKAIIAGASAAVLAAMPIVGVFATGSQEDVIQVGLQESCVIALNADGHTDGTDTVAGTWGSGADINTLSANVANGQYSINYGSSEMIINCNHNTGYAVTAVATDLEASTVEVSTGVKATLPLTSTFGDRESSGTVTSGWAYKVSAKAEAMTTNASDWYGSSSTKTNASLITGSAPISDGTFTVTYGVGVSETQPADTYTGSITYTIAAA